MLQLVASFGSGAELVAAYDAELVRNGLLVRGADVAHCSPMAACQVTVMVEGVAVARLETRVAAVVPGVGVAVVMEGVPPALVQWVDYLRSGGTMAAASAAASGAEELSSEEPGGPEEEPAEPTPALVSERLKALSVPQKMALALSAERDVRMALFRDPTKSLHLYVLRNPRIGLDEVLAAAKMNSLSPDALKFIAEHHEWGANASVCVALVRNPRLALPIALRLLDRIPPSELKAIARGGARDQLVQAARKRRAAG